MKKINSLLQLAKGIVIIISSALLACMIILMGLLFFLSPGKMEPFLDEKGNELKNSVSEKIFITINGVEQGMFIRGRDSRNPVLLLIHGGPGMPYYGLINTYPNATDIENDFTVCYWEQRGAGLSYIPGMSPETINVEQLVSDTVEVSNYLRDRFGQEKIYLMGHSWGTFIGIQAAAQSPQLYHAYIGIAQISNDKESEMLAYEYMLEQYKILRNNEIVKKLEEVSISEEGLVSYPDLSLRDAAMHRLGIGTTHNMNSVVTGVFLPIMQSQSYTLSEKINIWRAKAFLSNSTNLFEELYSTDLTVKISQVEIPVYFLSGIYDYTVSYKLSKDYFENLQAPVKGFYTFEQSAHSPLFEEPKKFLQILKEDVLNGATNLADVK